MLFWSNKKKSVCPTEKLNSVYKKLKDLYNENSINEDRKVYLRNLVKENGYLPYPYFKALEELNEAETLLALEEKWKQNNIFDGEKFNFDNPSILSRKNSKNSDWIKKEGHNIK